MNSFDISILAADKPFFNGKCESIIIPTSDGLYGIWANHQNLISDIIPGMLEMRKQNGETVIAAVSEGIVKVEDGNVLVLVDTIELPEEIDINRAKRNADRAKEELLQKRSIRDYYQAQARMARALNRMKVKNHMFH
ncbi:MAG: ATP synthase F1 subunit epsilon [Oscillospiraceae bacterium]|nr:MAG: ATP synthase F1 subunit epsilon [Oscillospiraceae bacterium]